MIFYDCSTAPSPRRVRMFIAEKGVDIETREVDLRNGEHLGAEYRAMNPDCTVPVLQLDDGTCLTEVLAICQYIDDTYPDPPLMGSGAAEQAQVTMWIIKIENHGLAAIAEHFRNKAKGFQDRALTGPVAYAQIPELVERGEKRLFVFLDRLDEHLSDREFIVGENFSGADISAFVLVEFAAWSKIDAGDGRPNLARWYSQVALRPSASV